MPARLPKDAGVSLIEILVAVMVIGVVSSAVVLSLQLGDSAIEEEADRLSARLIFARDEAITTGQPVGLILEEFGTRYSFERYVDGRWWPLAENPAFARHDLAEAVELEVVDVALAQAGQSEEGAPRYPLFWFDPAGLTEPFTLRLRDAEQTLELRWTARGSEGWERVAG